MSFSAFLKQARVLNQLDQIRSAVRKYRKSKVSLDKVNKAIDRARSIGYDAADIEAVLREENMPQFSAASSDYRIHPDDITFLAERDRNTAVWDRRVLDHLNYTDAYEGEVGDLDYLAHAICSDDPENAFKIAEALKLDMLPLEGGEDVWVELVDQMARENYQTWTQPTTLDAGQYELGAVDGEFGFIFHADEEDLFSLRQAYDLREGATTMTRLNANSLTEDLTSVVREVITSRVDTKYGEWFDPHAGDHYTRDFNLYLDDWTDLIADAVATDDYDLLEYGSDPIIHQLADVLFKLAPIGKHPRKRDRIHEDLSDLEENAIDVAKRAARQTIYLPVKGGKGATAVTRRNANPRWQPGGCGDLRRFTEKAVILREGEGTIQLDDEDEVHVAIVFEMSGYGPHEAAIFVDQNRYHASPDTALQGADEILEQYKWEHHFDEYENLVKDFGEQMVQDFGMFTENFDGCVWALSPEEAAAAIEGTDAAKFIDIYAPEEEDTDEFGFR